MSDTKRNDPAGNGVESESDLGGGSVPIVSPDSDAAVFFRHSYAVLVRGKSVRRHLYFNLPAAERTVKRALDRGDRADLVLVQLVPVDTRHLSSDGAE